MSGLNDKQGALGLKKGATLPDRRSEPETRSSGTMRSGSLDPDADISRPTLAGLGWLDDREASVLLVGSGHPMHAALSAALARHDVNLETAPASAVLDAVLAATPKLILLVGEAARDGGATVLEKLRTVELAAGVPVVVLAADNRFETRMIALRSGAAAVIPRSASVDAIASQAAELARAGSDDEVRAGIASTTTLREVLDVVGKRVTTRVLPKEAAAAEPERLELVLREGASLNRLFDEFSAELANQVIKAERIQYQLGKDETAAELLGDPELAMARSSSSAAGVRVLFADPDSMRADHMARALRAKGADVVVTGLFPHEEQMQRLRQFDPTALLVRSEHFSAGSGSLVDRLKEDPRLRWATLLVADWEDDPRQEAGEGSLENLLGQLAALGDADARLRARADAADSFETRLEILGPARSIRALAGCAGPLQMTTYNARATVRVEFGDGVIIGAHADLHELPGGSLDGPQALSTLLALRSGRVAVEPIREPTILNLMTTVGSALDMADSAPAPIQTSVPPPGFWGETPSQRPPPSRASKLPVYVGLGLTAAVAAGAMTAFLHTRNAPFGESSSPHRVASSVASAAPSPTVKDGLQIVAAPERARAVSPNASTPRAEAAVPNTASEPQPERPLVERARAGEADAMTALELKRPAERTVEETVALAQGRAATSRHAVSLLRNQSLSAPDTLQDPAVVRQWIGYARDPATASDALSAIATIPNSRSADLIYEVWVGTPGRSAATRLAEELVKTNSVHRIASPALAVVLDLRSADTCEAAKALLPRALEDGDRRSLSLLGRMTERRGCGPNKRSDCYPCLRGQDAARALANTIRAVRKRPAPVF